MTKLTRKPRVRRRPHNARTAHYGSFGELLDIVANEPRKVTLAGKDVTMTRTEALLRVMVDRALQGNTREMIKLLQMMAKDPALAANSRQRVIVFINGALANA